MWRPERAGVSVKYPRVAADPRTTLKVPVLWKKGGLCINHQRRMLVTSPFKKKRFFKYGSVRCAYRCLWSAKEC